MRTFLQFTVALQKDQSKLEGSFVQHWKIMASKNSVIQIYLFLINLIFYNEAKSYHAIVIIHGVLTGSESMELISNRIKEVGEMEQNDC